MNSRHLKWSVAAAAAIVGSAAVAGAGKFAQQQTLVEIVQQSTERFQDPAQAIEAGYAAMPNCVSGPEEGAMGVHYVDGALVGDGELDETRPEALVYEARQGRLQLVAVEYIVPAKEWHEKYPAPPVLAGQLFHYVGAPNRYGAPAFYELHVWAWQQNPSGTFADWNPKVSCDGFTVEAAATAHH